MTKIGNVYRIPPYLLRDIAPKDAIDMDVAYVKEDESSSIVFQTKWGSATFESSSDGAFNLIRWRQTPDGSIETTDEHPIKPSIFESAEKICLNYIKSNRK